MAPNDGWYEVSQLGPLHCLTLRVFNTNVLLDYQECPNPNACSDRSEGEACSPHYHAWPSLLLTLSLIGGLFAPLPWPSLLRMR